MAMTKKQRKAAERELARVTQRDALVRVFADKITQMKELYVASCHGMIEQAKLYVQLRDELREALGCDPWDVEIVEA